MLITTTPIIEGKRIVKYYGIVSGETIIGANVFRDLFASIRDIVGGRSGAYEEVLRKAKDTALQEMQAQAAQLGANAVIGVDLDSDPREQTDVARYHPEIVKRMEDIMKQEHIEPELASFKMPH